MPIFLLLGGGPKGSVGATISWIIGGLACAALVYALITGRRRRRRYGFPVRPMWAEVTIGLVGCVAALGAVWIANNYFWPEGLARQYAAEKGIPGRKADCRSRPASPTRSSSRSG